MGHDAAREAVDRLYGELMVDDEWSLRTPRGFTWWAHGLAQHVEASEPYRGPDGVTASAVRVWTDLAVAVGGDDDDGSLLGYLGAILDAFPQVILPRGAGPSALQTTGVSGG